METVELSGRRGARPLGLLRASGLSAACLAGMAGLVAVANAGRAGVAVATGGMLLVAGAVTMGLWLFRDPNRPPEGGAAARRGRGGQVVESRDDDTTETT